MKSMSSLELADHVQELTALIGAQLQDIETHKKGLAFSLYKRGRIWWLLELTPQSPMSVVLFEQTPWKKKEKPKPTSLFLSSHAKNLFLTQVEHVKDLGRVIRLEFSSSQKKVLVEVHLIPKAVNVLVRTEGKSISWEKPKDLQAPPQVEESHREASDIKSAWLDEQLPRKENKDNDSARKVLEKNIEKKQKALDAIQILLERDEAQEWFQKGEQQKASGDPQMQASFAKAKALERKKEGTAHRAELLQVEIQKLQTAHNKGHFETEKSPQKQLLQQAEASGRTQKIEGFIVSRGKSAQDNLAILRAAKAWDLWIHLRDYPSAYVILSLDKGKKASEEALRQSALWLAESSIKSKVKLSGTKLDVVVTECRFVRPIKGDKLGRVHYQNERVFTVIIP